MNLRNTWNCRVINGIQSSEMRNLFNPENIFLSGDGGGAGNNWANGYTKGDELREELIDMIGQNLPSSAKQCSCGTHSASLIKPLCVTIKHPSSAALLLHPFP